MRDSPTLHTFCILMVTYIFGYFNRQKNYAPSNLTWPRLEPMTFGSKRCPFKRNSEHKKRESPSLHTFRIILVTSIFGYFNRQKNYAPSNLTWPGFEPVTFGSRTLYIPQSYVNLLSDWRSLRKTKLIKSASSLSASVPWERKRTFLYFLLNWTARQGGKNVSPNEKTYKYSDITRIVDWK